MKHTKTIKLLLNFLRGKTTLEEKAKVDKWYDSISDANSLSNYSDSELSEIKEQLYQNIRLGLANKVIPLYKQSFFKAAAAAAVLIFSASGIYWASKTAIEKPDLTSTKPAILEISAPAENYATITLANGQKLELKGNETGTIAQQESMQLVKLANGQVVYKGTTADARPIEELQYNTLTNPKGSKVINLTLSDGSKVWLNSGSTLTYPVAFISDERKVTITGEAYFEVAHDKHKPFKVAKGDLEIKVLGTHFNVNAYDDEPNIKTTLVEGSVRVSGNDKQVVLLPNQQAVFGDDIQVKNVDVESEIAWKNGDFVIDGDDLESIMRKISRWYDVEVFYDAKPDEKMHFGGIVSRSKNISAVLKIMQSTGQVSFKVQGRKITVIQH